MRTILPAAAALAILVCGPAHAAEHVVSQKGKAFSVKRLNVNQGDNVKFINDDPFAHNIFSLSDVKSFDLGSYGQGLSKSVVMDKAGTVEVECAVHPDMKLVIEVKK
ncbi:cupredoxin domain-containing protein [Ramlibacter montanisoli]|jgi:plastocyanin|uniref:Methylamine utilization protein n=1 Tax=Ramlibacter montanisoli TaxID=2732512 RepID=A0A849KFT8_9BURK|nr:plastocyanin/azurin family copper-binding protein [Ramlibacter montanisoli]NNU45147.1 methylamine utilization protein [Ramlibacter montanisoli]